MDLSPLLPLIPPHHRRQSKRTPETQLNWPNFLEIPGVGRPAAPPRFPQRSDTRQNAGRAKNDNCGNPGQDYQFRYDDGLSARLGGRRIPFVAHHHGRNGESVHHPLPCPDTKPLRKLPAPCQPWWPPVSQPAVAHPKPPPCPEYVGLHVDYTRCPPSDFILRNF